MSHHIKGPYWVGGFALLTVVLQVSMFGPQVNGQERKSERSARRGSNLVLTPETDGVNRRMRIGNRPDAPLSLDPSKAKIKVVVMIDPSEFPEGAKIKKIETVSRDHGNKTLRGVIEHKDGRRREKLDGDYVLREAKITLVDGKVMEKDILVTIDPRGEPLKNFYFIGAMDAIGELGLGSWYAYNADLTMKVDSADRVNRSTSETARPKEKTIRR